MNLNMSSVKWRQFVSASVRICICICIWWTVFVFVFVFDQIFAGVFVFVFETPKKIYLYLYLYLIKCIWPQPWPLVTIIATLCRGFHGLGQATRCPAQGCDHFNYPTPCCGINHHCSLMPSVNVALVDFLSTDQFFDSICCGVLNSA